jgi:hypothetical protein
VRAQSEDTALTKSMKGAKIMDISKYLSAAQVAELQAVSKVLADIRKIKINGLTFHPVWLAPRGMET